MSADTIFEHRRPVKKSGLQKALPWIALAILVAGVLTFVGVKWANTGHAEKQVFSNQPVQDVSPVPKTTKLAPGATKAAREFIKTAVARENLRRAYFLSGPQIRQGQTLKEWMTGNIAVVPYPVDEVDYAPMKIDYSYPTEAMIEVALLPKQNAKVKPQLFIMDLKKIKGQWVVDSWVPRSAPLVPSGSSGTGSS